MFANEKKLLYIKVLIIIVLIIIVFFSNRFFNKKINYYKNLIKAKQKEIQIEREYKEKYFELEKNYDFEVLKKDEIVQNLNLIIDKNNIEILNMKTDEIEEKVLIDLKISSSYNNINKFLYQLSEQKGFYNLKNIIIKSNENKKNELLVNTKSIFRLSTFIENNYNNSSPSKKINTLKNPFYLQLNDNDYVLDSKDKEIIIFLPIKLMGIITGEKNKLAIVEINNKVKTINQGFENSEIEVTEIYKNNISVKYENLLFKINLGGNKGVLQ